jgi:hypothetical protein
VAWDNEVQGFLTGHRHLRGGDHRADHSARAGGRKECLGAGTLTCSATWSSPRGAGSMNEPTRTPRAPPEWRLHQDQ